jgi:hypothetical protein
MPCVLLVSNKQKFKYGNFIENKFVNRKLEKGGWSVPRAPVNLIRTEHGVVPLSNTPLITLSAMRLCAYYKNSV